VQTLAPTRRLTSIREVLHKAMAPVQVTLPVTTKGTMTQSQGVEEAAGQEAHLDHLQAHLDHLQAHQVLAARSVQVLHHHRFQKLPLAHRQPGILIQVCGTSSARTLRMR
jgi:hypothetical protein